MSKTLLNLKINQIKNDIKNAEDSLKDNEHFLDYVEKLKLVVNVDGKEVRVNRSTLVNYTEEKAFIETEIMMLKMRMRKYEEELD